MTDGVASKMTADRLLPTAQARKALRGAIWRSTWRYLALVAAITMIFAYAFVNSALPLGPERYDNTFTKDGSLRWSLALIAFGLALVLSGRKSSAFKRLVRRLPVAPTTVLQAQLQLGFGFGAVVLCTFTLIEFVASPPMMHPSFPGRLNLAETATLSRLPGIPLLRLTIDQSVTRALVSELSLAAMRTQDGSGNISNYGQRSRWPHFVDTPVLQPEATVATLKADDWINLEPFTKQRLHQLGLSSGAEVVIVLERYIPRHEYLSQPWRRDGLHRERSWHWLDRAIGFFGLLVFLICALRNEHNSLLLAFLTPLSLMFLHFSDFGHLSGRRFVLFSDLDYGKRPSFPTFGIQQTIAENLLWPLFVIVFCTLVYRFMVAQLRSSDGAAHSKKTPFFQQLRYRWRSGMRHRLELLAVPTLLVVYLGWLVRFGGFEVAQATSLIWSFAIVQTGPLALIMIFRWERRDALLSRLPISPATVARQRLSTALLSFILLALLPQMFQYYATSSHRWTLMLLILAMGCSLMLLILTLRGLTLGGRMGVMALFFLLMTGMMATWMLTSTMRVVVCLGLTGIQLPLIYRLMVKTVTLGRAPTFREFAGSQP